jgi:DNA-binding PadR family transcriptional regulator
MDRRAALSVHSFQILLALSSGESHGAAIVRAVLEQTDGELRLWPVRLYASLAALADAGLIAELEITPAGESERRRYYRITTRGRGTLAEEANRLEQTARLAKARLARSRA